MACWRIVLRRMNRKGKFILCIKNSCWAKLLFIIFVQLCNVQRVLSFSENTLFHSGFVQICTTVLVGAKMSWKMRIAKLSDLIVGFAFYLVITDDFCSTNLQSGFRLSPWCCPISLNFMIRGPLQCIRHLLFSTYCRNLFVIASYEFFFHLKSWEKYAPKTTQG